MLLSPLNEDATIMGFVDREIIVVEARIVILVQYFVFLFMQTRFITEIISSWP